MIDGSVFLRRELMIRFVRAFHKGSLETELDRFPVIMRPRQGKRRLVPEKANHRFAFLNSKKVKQRFTNSVLIGQVEFPCVF